MTSSRGKWRKSHQPDDLAHYHHLLSDFTSTVSAATSAFYLSTRLPPTPGNYSPYSLPSLPPAPPPSSLTPDDFATYFTKEVKDIRSSFTPMSILKAPSTTLTSVGLTCFSPLSSEDVHILVMSNHVTNCSLDPIPSTLLQDISNDILPFLTSLINSSLT